MQTASQIRSLHAQVQEEELHRPVRQTWPLVALGFGAMLLLGAAVSTITLNNISGFRKSILGVTDLDQSRREHIEALRSQIYISSILIRDLLLDTRTGADNSYRSQLRASHAAALAQLKELQAVSTGASATVDSLLAEVNAYWRSVDALLSDEQGNSDPHEQIRASIIPRRQAVIALAEELADAGWEQARSSREALVASMDDFQTYSIVLRAVTTLLAAALALFTVLRVFRLERASGAERARLTQAEHDLRQLSQQIVTSQEQERRSLSRELHDQVGQLVTALRFGLTDLERQAAPASREFLRIMTHCREMLEQTIEAVRGIAMGLRPTMLDDLGLAAAIEWQAREFSKTFNIPVTSEVDTTLAECPEPQKTALYRIAQEALTNCARHAHATEVRIEMKKVAGHVRLLVADNGVGLPDGPRRRGFGLLGMEERVREIGGRLAFGRPPGGGTVLEVLVPLDGVAAHA